MKDKVILFYPPYEGPPLSAPLCLLALASPLLANGIRVRVVDQVTDPDYESAILRESDEALCLGISVLTGPMIHSAARVAKSVKKVCPDLPIILGGWHPSLLPEQTLCPEYVDVVVRGQGELTLLDIAHRLSAGRSLEGVEGVSRKEGVRAIHEHERRVENINDLPTPAFHIADFDAYEKICGVRKLAYATSVGCPYACNYCTDQVFYKRRFNAYAPERVVSELAELVQRYRIEFVALLDSNFPVDVRRALAIARGIVDTRVRFDWTFQASTDFLCRMSDDDVRLLASSGVTHMGFGTESASQEVLALMNKKHQRIDQMFETARKAEVGGIHVTFNLIFGYPGETERDRIDTLRIMSEIARQYGNVSFSPNIFTPYPGIPVWPQLKEMGVREPQSFEEWADLPLGKNILPWLQGAELHRLRTMLEYFLLHNHIRRMAKNSPRLRRLRRALGAPLRWRVRSNCYGFPWELWVARATERLVTRRSLLTGQKLSGRIEEVC